MATVSRRIREAVLRRDGYKCVYCLRGLVDGVLLTVDHIRPRVRGGGNAGHNLAACCTGCNSRKGATWE